MSTDRCIDSGEPDGVLPFNIGALSSWAILSVCSVGIKYKHLRLLRRLTFLQVHCLILRTVTKSKPEREFNWKGAL